MDPVATTYLTVAGRRIRCRGRRILACWRRAISSSPTMFNLLVVYNPPSGGVGVAVPVLVEQFNDVSLGNVAGHVRRRIRADHGGELRRGAEPQPLRVRPDELRRQRGAAGDHAQGHVRRDHNQLDAAAEPARRLDRRTRISWSRSSTNGAARLRFGDNTNGISRPAARCSPPRIASAMERRATSARRA